MRDSRKLLGYEDPQEWSKVSEPFTDTFVDDKSADKQNATDNFSAKSEAIIWKNGEMVKTQLILVPYIFKNHMFALHFIE